MISDISLVKRKAALFVQTRLYLFTLDFNWLEFPLFLFSISQQTKVEIKDPLPKSVCQKMALFLISYLNFALVAMTVIFFLGHM